MAQSILNDKFELTILSNLIYNEEFARKAVPFLKEEFFKFIKFLFNTTYVHIAQTFHY